MRRGSDKVEPVDADLCFERSTSAVTASSETPLVFATAAKERCKLFRRGGAANSCVVDGDNPEVVLDPTDAGIEEAIKRLERKSFIQDGLIPEVQKLLAVPAVQAKEAYLAALSQYSLVMMLVLASLLGAALNPLRVEDYPDSSMSATRRKNEVSFTPCSSSTTDAARGLCSMKGSKIPVQTHSELRWRQGLVPWLPQVPELRH